MRDRGQRGCGSSARTTHGPPIARTRQVSRRVYNWSRKHSKAHCARQSQTRSAYPRSLFCAEIRLNPAGQVRDPRTRCRLTSTQMFSPASYRRLAWPTEMSGAPSRPCLGCPLGDISLRACGFRCPASRALKRPTHAIDGHYPASVRHPYPHIPGPGHSPSYRNSRCLTSTS